MKPEPSGLCEEPETLCTCWRCQEWGGRHLSWIVATGKDADVDRASWSRAGQLVQTYRMADNAFAKSDDEILTDIVADLFQWAIANVVDDIDEIDILFHRGMDHAVFELASDEGSAAGRAQSNHYQTQQPKETTK